MRLPSPSMLVLGCVLSCFGWGCEDPTPQEGKAPVRTGLKSQRLDAGGSLTTPALGDQTLRVLMLPGIAGSDAHFQPFLRSQELADRGVFVMAANPPGFRGLPMPVDMQGSVADYAQWVEGIVKRYGIDVLMGHSFSGNVLVEVARRGNFDGPLVIISPSLRAVDDGPIARYLGKVSRFSLGEWFAGKLVSSGLTSAMGHLLAPDAPEELHRLLIEEGRATDPGRIARLYDAFFEHLDEWKDLAPILVTSPNRIWVVRGEFEWVGLSADARAAFRESGHIEFVEVPGSKHFPMLEQPDIFLRSILLPATATGH